MPRTTVTTTPHTAMSAADATSLYERMVAPLTDTYRRMRTDDLWGPLRDQDPAIAQWMLAHSVLEHLAVAGHPVHLGVAEGSDAHTVEIRGADGRRLVLVPNEDAALGNPEATWWHVLVRQADGSLVRDLNEPGTWGCPSVWLSVALGDESQLSLPLVADLLADAELAVHFRLGDGAQ